jgi:flagellar hook-associated protein 1 FlgK
MSGLIGIGTRALLANQLALQTAGNNTANVNTVGYSRQSVLLQSVAGQFSGSGYYGDGVDATTVLRSHSEFLTRQAAVSGSVAAADSKRLEQLKQLEDIFPGGKNGLGAAVGDMLNAFSDVASNPTDLSARTVVLARADEMAARFRSAATGLASLQQGGQEELRLTVVSINSLATRIAKANEQIAHESGSGHTPNDLLDQRDQLIKELNGLVQTTNIPAGDGSIGIFVAGSQPLVLGKTVAPLAMAADEFGDPAKSKLTITRGATSTPLDETTLGAGALSGLLRFQNTDLVETSNMLGRMALALGTKVNEQQRLGLDLSGTPGADLFVLGPVAGALPTVLAAAGNTGSATVQVAIQTTPASGATSLAASDYELSFSGASTGTIKRLSDGQVTAFGAVPALIDGLSLQVSAGAVAGDRFLVTPFRQAAASLDTSFSSPHALAMASPVSASAGAANQGSLTMQSLGPRQANANMGQTVVLTFNGAGSFNVSGTGTGNPTGVAYTPGQTISYNGWAMTLKGTPKAGDSYTVQANAFPLANGGNAEAMLGLRDIAMFDGAATTEGYAALMSNVGVRVQNAGFAANVSQAIATTAEADRSAVAGVNLDEEAAKLLQFQQAYQASAKILQVSQSIFDTLMQNLAH